MKNDLQNPLVMNNYTAQSLVTKYHFNKNVSSGSTGKLHIFDLMEKPPPTIASTQQILKRRVWKQL